MLDNQTNTGRLFYLYCFYKTCMNTWTCGKTRKMGASLFGELKLIYINIKYFPLLLVMKKKDINILINNHAHIFN